jgi:hypothetical protein
MEGEILITAGKCEKSHLRSKKALMEARRYLIANKLRLIKHEDDNR